MTTEERQIREDYAAWIESTPKPNEYNRMHIDHLTSFTEGYKSIGDFKLELIQEIENEIKEFSGLMDQSFAKGYELGLKRTLELLKK